MDDIGLGVQNGSDATSSPSSVTVGPDSATNQTVALSDPSINWGSTPGPTVQMIAPISNGVVLQISPATSNGVEVPPFYQIEWSTSTSFQPSKPV